MLDGARFYVNGLLPGVKINTSATDFAPISQVQLERSEGETWERFGDIIKGEAKCPSSRDEWRHFLLASRDSQNFRQPTRLALRNRQAGFSGEAGRR
jgi:hypothetical protein